MTKPFSLSKTDILNWMHAFAAYFIGGLLVGLGVTLEHLNLGIWNYLLVAIGGALADLGRRFIADTRKKLVSKTETIITETTTNSSPMISSTISTQEEISINEST